MARYPCLALLTLLAPASAHAQEEPGSVKLYGKEVSTWAEMLSGNPAQRLEASDALRGVGPKGVAAVPALIDALGDPDPQIRRHAAYALGGIGPGAKGAVPKLREAMKDDEEIVRYSAVQAIGKIGPDAKEAARDLRRALGDRNGLIAVRAAEAMYHVDDSQKQRAIDDLKDTYRDDTNADQVRLEAAVTMARLIPKEASNSLPLLRLSYENADPWMQVRIADAIGRIDPEGVQKVIPALEYFMNDANERERVRVEAAVALARLDPRRVKLVIPTLIKYVRGGNGTSRLAAAEALREIDPATALRVGVP